MASITLESKYKQALSELLTKYDLGPATISKIRELAQLHDQVVSSYHEDHTDTKKKHANEMEDHENSKIHLNSRIAELQTDLTALSGSLHHLQKSTSGIIARHLKHNATLDTPRIFQNRNEMIAETGKISDRKLDVLQNARGVQNVEIINHNNQYKDSVDSLDKSQDLNGNSEQQISESDSVLNQIGIKVFPPIPILDLSQTPSIAEEENPSDSSEKKNSRTGSLKIERM